MRLHSILAAAILGLVLFVPVLCQETVNREKAPKVANPESIPPTTGCEGMTGALPEAVSECQRRETARLFIILGKPQAAVRILCGTRVAKDAFKDKTDECLNSN